MNVLIVTLGYQAFSMSEINSWFPICPHHPCQYYSTVVEQQLYSLATFYYISRLECLADTGWFP